MTEQLQQARGRDHNSALTLPVGVSHELRMKELTAMPETTVKNFRFIIDLR